ncbi:DNA-binding protein OS=Streptomyces antimycoticus OX=68175 GN=SANT12839_009460 PE=4 SV=1 [Streptomyces antimycoticus]
MAKPVRAAIGDVWITCVFCKGDLFRDREVKLNSTGMELFEFGWC